MAIVIMGVRISAALISCSFIGAGLIGGASFIAGTFVVVRRGTSCGVNDATRRLTVVGVTALSPGAGTVATRRTVSFTIKATAGINVGWALVKTPFADPTLGYGALTCRSEP
jgi:hypothetical protein